MEASFSAFETMVEEASNRGGEWLFEYGEIERIGDLQDEFEVANPRDAIKSLKIYIEKYFKERGLIPVVEIGLDPPRAKIVSNDSARFLLDAKKLRGVKREGKEFENLVARQLSGKLTGQIINVGYPRKNNKSAIFKQRLKELGVDVKKLKHVKDGGLDVIWLPPLGKKSEIPFVNFQCKNTEVFGNDVKVSVLDARKTWSRHKRLSESVFLIFVVANTYLTPKMVDDANGRGYVCLGLPELLECSNPNPPAVYM